MHKNYSLLALISLSLTLSMAQAEEKNKTNNDNASLKIETQTNKSVLTGTLYHIWHKLRALTPTDANAAGNKSIIATAGIRGTQTTDTLIQLYWKDDQTQDEAFIKEITLYNLAQSQLEQGHLTESKTTLENFLQQYPKSTLKPNAAFTQALLASATGETQNSIKLFKQFMQDNPKHPLISDAEAALNDLSVKR